MSLYKSLPNIEKSFPHVHQTLTRQGFTKVEKDKQWMYQAKLYDASNEQHHTLNIPVDMKDNKNKVRLGQAYFENQDVSSSVVHAAASKLSEIAEYLNGGESNY